MQNDKELILKNLSVSELTHYLRELIETDEILADIWIRGEVSNLSIPSSGHIYFTLKDATASLRCVIWRSNVYKLNIDLRNGMSVEVHGDIKIYEAGGHYQLNSDFVRHRGEGNMFQEFLNLKDKLEKEGIFDPERKKPIPEKIRRLGIVSSLTGAAIQDIIQTLERRNPLLEVVVAGTPVQGEAAPMGIIEAIKKLEDQNSLDLILIARGGGSIEDLWAFNNESVVRAISNCSIPVITGIGHETDFTLSDFAADLRAPTPTAAAEIATGVTIAELYNQLEGIGNYLNKFMKKFFFQLEIQVEEISNRLTSRLAMRKIHGFWQELDEISTRIKYIANSWLNMEYSKNKNIKDKIKNLNPIELMRRGFSIITRSEDQRIINSAKQVKTGDNLTVQTHDGKYGVNVNLVEI